MFLFAGSGGARREKAIPQSYESERTPERLSLRVLDGGAPAATGPDLAPAQPHGAGTLPECAERLRRDLGAERVTLNRVYARLREVEIVGSAGRAFLSPGVRLPAASSSVLLEAAAGRCGWRQADGARRPLDRLALAVGLRSSCSVPILVGGVPAGALTAQWRGDRPSIDDPARIAAGTDTALLAALALRPAPAARVLVCHEQEVAGRGLAEVTAERLGARVETCRTLADAFDAIARGAPDLIVCSERLSPEQGIGEVAGDLRAAGADAPIVVVAQLETVAGLAAARRAGARGYLALAAGVARLEATLLAALQGTAGGGLALVQDGERQPRLTAREREILRAYDRGLSDKEVARELGVTVSTVKTHARRTYEKLDARSRTAALHRARAHDLL
jgi:DNA-binding NarL/FixJ family response regulator